MKSKFVKKAFTADLPATFTSLKKPLYIGVTDANTAEYILLNTGPLVAPLMGTMAIPGVFEAVAFKNMLLVD
jgi:NTE family protein